MFSGFKVQLNSLKLTSSPIIGEFSYTHWGFLSSLRSSSRARIIALSSGPPVSLLSSPAPNLENEFKSGILINFNLYLPAWRGKASNCEVYIYVILELSGLWYDG